MPVNQHALAAGWGLTLPDLDLITSLADADGNSFPSPRALGTYSPGTLEPRGDMSITVGGVAAVSWIWEQGERGMRKVLRIGYCGPSLKDHSGKVTLLTPIEDPDEYYLCNAWLYLPPIDQVSYDGSVDWITAFAVRFVIEEILDAP